MSAAAAVAGLAAEPAAAPAVAAAAAEPSGPGSGCATSQTLHPSPFPWGRSSLNFLGFSYVASPETRYQREREAEI
uniref:Putative secreted protein n=1 Tax=Ixodes ricinus TaxID=34613 RepID=A0A6B0TTS8_IXORI